MNLITFAIVLIIKRSSSHQALLFITSIINNGATSESDGSAGVNSWEEEELGRSKEDGAKPPNLKNPTPVNNNN